MKLKKLLCILLIMMLMIGVIPTTALAADVSETSLETVSFAEFELKKFYKDKPANEMEFKALTEGIDLVKDVTTEASYTIYVDQQGIIGDRFDSKLGNGLYWLGVEITAKSGYELDLVAEGNFLKVGDEYIDATHVIPLENSYKLYYKLGTPPEQKKEPVEVIEIEGLTIPKEGEEPDYDLTVPEGKGYFIDKNTLDRNGVRWSENLPDGSSRSLVPGEAVFEAGKSYNISATITLEEGYKFAAYDVYATEAYINGIPAQLSSGYKDWDKTLYLSVTFEVIKEYDLIVEGGEAYIVKGNTPTVSEWDTVDSAAAGNYIRIEAYEIEGWEFDHWEILEGNIDDFVNRYKAFFTMPECDVKIRAYYKSLEGDKVTYFHNMIFCFGDDPIAGRSVAHGEITEEPEEPYQEGKVFLGWYTKDGKKYDFSTPVTEEVVLTARFVDESELHDVILCFGNSPIAGQSVVHGETAVEPEDPYQEGKVFLGWYTKDGKKYDFSTPVTKDVILTAKFECVTHTWGKGVVSKKATCTAAGTLKYTCKECGKTKTSTIYKASGVKLSAAAYVYNGKIKNPTVVVKDSRGKAISSANYTIIKPVGRKNVGQYTYTIQFKNQYSGTKKLTLKINPKGTSVSSLSGAKNAFTVKWKKQSEKMATARITGYQIQCSTNKKFTTSKIKTVSGYSNTSSKMTGLKAKTTYYVRVRTYKTVTVNGKSVKLYSGWSGYKTIKTK